MTVTENIMSAMEKLNASPEETCRYGSAMSLKHATCRSFASTTECQQTMALEHCFLRYAIVQVDRISS